MKPKYIGLFVVGTLLVMAAMINPAAAAAIGAGLAGAGGLLKEREKELPALRGTMGDVKTDSPDKPLSQIADQSLQLEDSVDAQGSDDDRFFDASDTEADVSFPFPHLAVPSRIMPPTSALDYLRNTLAGIGDDNNQLLGNISFANGTRTSIILGQHAEQIAQVSVTAASALDVAEGAETVANTTAEVVVEMRDQVTNATRMAGEAKDAADAIAGNVTALSARTDAVEKTAAEAVSLAQNASTAAGAALQTATRANQTAAAAGALASQFAGNISAISDRVSKAEEAVADTGARVDQLDTDMAMAKGNLTNHSEEINELKTKANQSEVRLEALETGLASVTSKEDALEQIVDGISGNSSPSVSGSTVGLSVAGAAVVAVGAACLAGKRRRVAVRPEAMPLLGEVEEGRAPERALLEADVRRIVQAEAKPAAREEAVRIVREAAEEAERKVQEAKDAEAGAVVDAQAREGVLSARITEAKFVEARGSFVAAVAAHRAVLADTKAVAPDDHPPAVTPELSTFVAETKEYSGLVAEHAARLEVESKVERRNQPLGHLVAARHLNNSCELVSKEAEERVGDAIKSVERIALVVRTVGSDFVPSARDMPAISDELARLDAEAKAAPYIAATLLQAAEDAMHAVDERTDSLRLVSEHVDAAQKTAHANTSMFEDFQRCADKGRLIDLFVRDDEACASAVQQVVMTASAVAADDESIAVAGRASETVKEKHDELRALCIRMDDICGLVPGVRSRVSVVLQEAIAFLETRLKEIQDALSAQEQIIREVAAYGSGVEELIAATQAGFADVDVLRRGDIAHNVVQLTGRLDSLKAAQNVEPGRRWDRVTSGFLETIGRQAETLLRELRSPLPDSSILAEFGVVSRGVAALQACIGEILEANDAAIIAIEGFFGELRDQILAAINEYSRNPDAANPDAVRAILAQIDVMIPIVNASQGVAFTTQLRLAIDRFVRLNNPEIADVPPPVDLANNPEPRDLIITAVNEAIDTLNIRCGAIITQREAIEKLRALDERLLTEFSAHRELESKNAEAQAALTTANSIIPIDMVVLLSRLNARAATLRCMRNSLERIERGLQDHANELGAILQSLPPPGGFDALIRQLQPDPFVVAVIDVTGIDFRLLDGDGLPQTTVEHYNQLVHIGRPDALLGLQAAEQDLLRWQMIDEIIQAIGRADIFKDTPDIAAQIRAAIASEYRDAYLFSEPQRAALERLGRVLARCSTIGGLVVQANALRDEPYNQECVDSVSGVVDAAAEAALVSGDPSDRIVVSVDGANSDLLRRRGEAISRARTILSEVVERHQRFAQLLTEVRTGVVDLCFGGVEKFCVVDVHSLVTTGSAEAEHVLQLIQEGLSPDMRLELTSNPDLCLEGNLVSVQRMIDSCVRVGSYLVVDVDDGEIEDAFAVCDRIIKTGLPKETGSTSISRLQVKQYELAQLVIEKLKPQRKALLEETASDDSDSSGHDGDAGGPPGADYEGAVRESSDGEAASDGYHRLRGGEEETRGAAKASAASGASDSVVAAGGYQRLDDEEEMRRAEPKPGLLDQAGKWLFGFISGEKDAKQQPLLDGVSDEAGYGATGAVDMIPAAAPSPAARTSEAVEPPGVESKDPNPGENEDKVDCDQAPPPAPAAPEFPTPADYELRDSRDQMLGEMLVQIETLTQALGSADEQLDRVTVDDGVINMMDVDEANALLDTVADIMERIGQVSRGLAELAPDGMDWLNDVVFNPIDMRAGRDVTRINFFANIRARGELLLQQFGQLTTGLPAAIRAVHELGDKLFARLNAIQAEAKAKAEAMAKLSADETERKAAAETKAREESEAAMARDKSRARIFRRVGKNLLAIGRTLNDELKPRVEGFSEEVIQAVEEVRQRALTILREAMIPGKPRLVELNRCAERLREVISEVTRDRIGPQARTIRSDIDTTQRRIGAVRTDLDSAGDPRDERLDEDYSAKNRLFISYSGSFEASVARATDGFQKALCNLEKYVAAAKLAEEEKNACAIAKLEETIAVKKEITADIRATFDLAQTSRARAEAMVGGYERMVTELIGQLSRPMTPRVFEETVRREREAVDAQGALSRQCIETTEAYLTTVETRLREAGITVRAMLGQCADLRAAYVQLQERIVVSQRRMDGRIAAGPYSLSMRRGAAAPEAAAAAAGTGADSVVNAALALLMQSQLKLDRKPSGDIGELHTEFLGALADCDDQSMFVELMNGIAGLVRAHENLNASDRDTQIEAFKCQLGCIGCLEGLLRTPDLAEAPAADASTRTASTMAVSASVESIRVLRVQALGTAGRLKIIDESLREAHRLIELLPRVVSLVSEATLSPGFGTRRDSVMHATGIFEAVHNIITRNMFGKPKYIEIAYSLERLGKAIDLMLRVLRSPAEGRDAEALGSSCRRVMYRCACLSADVMQNYLFWETVASRSRRASVASGPEFWAAHRPLASRFATLPRLFVRPLVPVPVEEGAAAPATPPPAPTDTAPVPETPEEAEERRLAEAFGTALDIISGTDDDPRARLERACKVLSEDDSPHSPHSP